ncbi:MAG TPA: hypothetical protein VF277_09970 [Steroidobacteraceae bacterium]
MSALQWVRAKQRDLAKVVLALFCLAWLQAAAMPCAMAASLPSDPAHHCQYCPPPATGTPDPGHSEACAYPHAPQVDSRVTSALFFVVPVTTVIAKLDAQPVETMPTLAAVDPGIASTAFAVSYCRLLL